MANILKKWVESDARELKRIGKRVDKIEALKEEMEGLSDAQLQAKTPEFKERLANGETLDDILVEAFAVCREAAKRVLGLFPFRVQLIGGIVLHGGNIAEMKTGEGKTLTATLPVYLNALAGQGVHVVTVNEYLANRDATEMGELYKWLGLTVGANTADLSPDAKREAYNCDITYSTNSEIGFDYLRDNMVVYKEDMVQRPLNFALIDEVDSVLIDEARTPLIISGESEPSVTLYERADQFVKTLNDSDYMIDWESKAISLTEDGIRRGEHFFNTDNLFDVENSALNHHIDQALRANYIMLKDKDYVVSNGEVLIVDSFTGRVMEGRRFSDGLHQAIEAKEHVEIQPGSKTMATITYQNMFRMYKKLSGMTGTARTEAEEFRDIYNMEVVSIPTNEPVVREDRPDLLYPTLESKFKAVVKEIRDLYIKGQPVLVGTVAVETSEYLSRLLDRENIPHVVLNAKNHAREAEIVANAGQKSAVTIATNMAGRGTDIKLGPGVVELGGLAVIGTERHESRRIDNQLRGRSGRQGDVGMSQFYLSLEDDLMIRFGSERIRDMLSRMKVADEDAVIQSGLISRQVESAQKRVEGNNYDARKNVLQYDDVMRAQREVMYEQRQEVIMEENSLKEPIMGMIYRTIDRVVDAHTRDGKKNYDLETIVEFARTALISDKDIVVEDIEGMSAKDIKKYLKGLADNMYQEKEDALYDPEQILEFEKVVILRVVDQHWTDHIDAMDQLRQSVGLRGYGQLNPLVEYQQEGYRMYNEMITSIEYEVTRLFMKSQIRQNLER